MGTPDEPGPLTDEETAQLTWDRLLLCFPVFAREGSRQGSPEGVSEPPPCRPVETRGALADQTAVTTAAPKPWEEYGWTTW
jgi:hypothetical protein